MIISLFILLRSVTFMQFHRFLNPIVQLLIILNENGCIKNILGFSERPF